MPYSQSSEYPETKHDSASTNPPVSLVQSPSTLQLAERFFTEVGTVAGVRRWQLWVQAADGSITESFFPDDKASGSLYKEWAETAAPNWFGA